MSDANGEALYLFPGPSLTIVENTIELRDLDEFVKSLQPTFVQVDVTRRVAGPMAGGFMPEAAVYFALGAAAGAFLGELGKDAYRVCRAALFGVYRKAKTWANSRGYAPLSIAIGDESGVSIVFVFKAGLSQDEFEIAVRDLLETLRDVDRSTGDPMMPYVVMEVDDETGRWRRSTAF
jgi:hypothetical protein